jgi:hypothetical protein
MTDAFLQFSRPFLRWLIEPAFTREPGSLAREWLLTSASLLARFLLVVYRTREKILSLLGANRGESATRNDNASQ